MDLRIERTKKSIINAFIELRSKKPIEKITIKELAELAYINKATFYTHYKDIYDLTEQLEDEVINSVIESIPNSNILITEPKKGTYELCEAFLAKRSLINILFSGTRKYIFEQKMENILKDHICKTFPEYGEDLEKSILLSVLIQGCIHTFPNHLDRDGEEVISTLANISDCLINNYVSDK